MLQALFVMLAMMIVGLVLSVFVTRHGRIRG